MDDAEMEDAQRLSAAARRLGLDSDVLHPYGRDVAKVDLSVLERPRAREGLGRLVLVSAITPTPAGEGKTTTSIGLADALAGQGESVCLALREPSLGPALGMKGGATGGGASQVVPSVRINLHFTGDFHAITSAHNFLSAIIDNHLHRRSEIGLDPRRVLWRRVLDVNDRALRDIVVGLGGPANGVPRETGFDITAASELMAILCLAEGVDDLRQRLGRILVGFDFDGGPVLADDLGVTGALLALLVDALRPNLVRTLEGTPALIHGGPFANIAHGCNSVLATRMGLQLADWVVTEAGFGFDLGAEKFFDIKCVGAGLDTAAVVLVATVRALKHHGGVASDALSRSDPAAVSRGLPNLEKHVENIRIFGESPVVALNRFASDDAREIDVVRRHCETLGVPFAVSDHFARGGAGAAELATTLQAHAERSSRPFRPLYDWSDPVEAKVEAVAKSMYGAAGVVFSNQARGDLRRIEKLGYGGLPVCIAKIPSSLADRSASPGSGGRPAGFEIEVRRIEINAGAGFLVVLTGTILRMPGLPLRPRAEAVDVRGGEVVGVG